ncbi:MAG: hypothetical protein RMJ66_00245, partial [Bacteroidia bacterium]|nr:hypothetical protein [Bacteroidia bacterium]MDW8133473.1 hypothetical protein [Bacteroidia bacterium]
MRRQLLGIFFLISDFALSYIGWIVFYWVRRYYLYQEVGLPATLWEYLWAPLLVATYWTLTYGLGGSYKDPIRQSIMNELFNRAWLSTLGSLALFFLAFLDDPIPNYKTYRTTLLLYIALQIGLSWFSLMLMRLVVFKILRRRMFRFPTVIVGSGSQAYSVWQEL